MSELLDEPPLSGRDPTDILSLLRCCYCSELLDAPTTLRCGHTVCSVHVRSAADISTTAKARKHSSPRSPSESMTLSTGSVDTPPISKTFLPSCPVEDCVAVSNSSRISSLTTLPPSSRVAYYPPPMSAESSTSSSSSMVSAAAGSSKSGSGGFPRLMVASPKQDITVARLLHLATEAVQEADRRRLMWARSIPQPRVSNEEDSESDEERPGTHRVAQPTPTTSQSLPAAPSWSSGNPAPPSRTSRSHTPPTPDPADISPNRKLKRRRTDDQLPASNRESRSPRPHPDQRDKAFTKTVFSELHCEICFSLFYNPVTTPCQHVRILARLASFGMPDSSLRRRRSARSACHERSTTVSNAPYVDKTCRDLLISTSMLTIACSSLSVSLFWLRL